MKAKFVSMVLFSVLTLTAFTTVASASSRSLLKKGIRAYEQKNFQKALSLFRDAQVENPDDLQVVYNTASAQYKNGDFRRAADGFKKVVSRAGQKTLKEKALYNLGNTAYRRGNLKAAAEFYRQALAIAQDDLEAKENLDFVLKQIHKKKTQKNQESSRNRGQRDRGSQLSSPGKNSGGGQEKPKQNRKEPEPPARQNRHGSYRPGGSKERNPVSGTSRETSGKNKTARQGTSSTTASPVQKPSYGNRISREEAERLLNSLDNDQRLFFRKQAARKGPAETSVGPDW